MAFEKGKALIEQVNEAYTVYVMLEEHGEDYCEPDELEATLDEKHDIYLDALDRLTEYLQHTIVGIDRQVAWEMAENKRTKIYALFSSAR